MKTFIFGAGAHGRVVLEILLAQGQYDFLQFVDDEKAIGLLVNGVPVVGGLDYVLQQDQDACEMIVAIGHPIVRSCIGQMARDHGIRMLCAVHPSAVIASTATIAGGAMIGAGVVVNSNAMIGADVSVNSAAVVEHDCVISDGATVCSGVQLGARVMIGRGAFICTGAIVLPRVRVGDSAIVAAGSIATKDVLPKVLVMGSPARVVRQVDEAFEWAALL